MSASFLTQLADWEKRGSFLETPQDRACQVVRKRCRVLDTERIEGGGFVCQFQPSPSRMEIMAVDALPFTILLAALPWQMAIS